MKENQGMVENQLDREIERELNRGEPLPVPSHKSNKLTEENLDKVTNSIRDEISEIEDAINGKPTPKPKSIKSSKLSAKSSKKAKPAWAMTEKQQDDDKEAEIDNLLEFAYELDYEKYMGDFEVR